jgi:hypothetical protein
VFGKNSNLKLAYEKKNGPVANDANSGRFFEMFYGIKNRRLEPIMKKNGDGQELNAVA